MAAAAPIVNASDEDALYRTASGVVDSGVVASGAVAAATMTVGAVPW